MSASPTPRIWTLCVTTLVLALGLYALEVWVLQGYLILSSRQVLAGGELPPLQRLDTFYNTLPGILLNAATSSAWVGIVALVAAALSATPLRTRLGLVPARLGGAAWVLVPLGGLAVSQAVDHAFTLTSGGRGAALDTLLGALAQARGFSLASTVLVVGVLSGTCEELFFRGYLQRRLVERFGPWPGIALPAALFALAHGDLHHGTFALLFGVFVGWAAWAGGSTWIAIAAHVVNNTLAVLTLALGFDDSAASRGEHLAVLGASVAVVAAVAAWLARQGRAARRASAEAQSARA